MHASPLIFFEILLAAFMEDCNAFPGGVCLQHRSRDSDPDRPSHQGDSGDQDPFVQRRRVAVAGEDNARIRLQSEGICGTL